MIVVQDFLDCFQVFQCGFRSVVVALVGQSMSEIQEMELSARFRSAVLNVWRRRCRLGPNPRMRPPIGDTDTVLAVHAAVLPSNKTPRDLSHGDLVAALRNSSLSD